MTDAVALVAFDYVTVEIASVCTGLSVAAINSKIDGGVWARGKEYIIGPDNKRYISRAGFKQWVEKGRYEKSRGRSRKTKLDSPGVQLGRETTSSEANA